MLSEKQEGTAFFDNMQWALELFNEPGFPHVGLPVRWQETEQRHAKIAYDPVKNKSFEIDSGAVVKYKQSPVGFIASTKGKYPIGDTQAPASVAVERYLHPKFQEALVENARGEVLAPCLAHGDYIKVEALAADHLQAKSEITKRQKAIVDRLNSDPGFSEFVMRLGGMDKFFVKAKMPDDDKEKFYGTLFFYEIYFNSIDNIWLICSVCNSKKSNLSMLEWLRGNELFGEEFIESLGKITAGPIFAKTEEGKGIAEKAIEWFWVRHGKFLEVEKRLQEEVVKPIQRLNKEVDELEGSGDPVVRKKAEDKRLQLDIKLDLASSAARSDISIPKVVHTSKGEVFVTAKEIADSMKSVIEQQSALVEQKLIQEISARAEADAECDSESDTEESYEPPAKKKR